MSGSAPRRNGDQFVVRMPSGMRDQLKRRAEENRRSLNSEIVYRLETAMAAEATRSRDGGGPAAGESLEA